MVLTDSETFITMRMSSASWVHFSYFLYYSIRLQNDQVTNWLCYKVVWLGVGNWLWLIYGYKLSLLQSGIVTKWPCYKVVVLQSVPVTKWPGYKVIGYKVTGYKVTILLQSAVFPKIVTLCYSSTIFIMIVTL